MDPVINFCHFIISLEVIFRHIAVNGEKIKLPKKNRRERIKKKCLSSLRTRGKVFTTILWKFNRCVHESRRKSLACNFIVQLRRAFVSMEGGSTPTWFDAIRNHVELRFIVVYLESCHCLNKQARTNKCCLVVELLPANEMSLVSRGQCQLFKILRFLRWFVVFVWG